MFDQYVKLFNVDWIQPWLIEAVAIMLAATLVGLVVCKVTECFSKE